MASQGEKQKQPHSYYNYIKQRTSGGEEERGREEPIGLLRGQQAVVIIIEIN